MKTRAILTTSLLLLTTLAIAAPPASAHDCSAPDPATQCGACPGGESHDHRFSDGTPYCSSRGPDNECLVRIGPICVLRDVQQLVEELRGSILPP